MPTHGIPVWSVKWQAWSWPCWLATVQWYLPSILVTFLKCSWLVCSLLLTYTSESELVASILVPFGKKHCPVCEWLLPQQSLYDVRKIIITTFDPLKYRCKSVLLLNLCIISWSSSVELTESVIPDSGGIKLVTKAVD